MFFEWLTAMTFIQVPKSADSRAESRVWLDTNNAYRINYTNTVRAEMGRFPLLLPIIKQVLKYNVYLRAKDSNSIVKQALSISDEISSKLTKSYGNRFNELLQFCDVSENHRISSLSQKTITEALSSLKSKFINFWQEKLDNSPKLEFYRKIKSNYTPELFLDELYNCNAKRDLLRFRTSNHSLSIETGRYCNPKIPRTERLCQHCELNEVEDENHLLFNCSLYSDIRCTFFEKLANVFHITTENRNNIIMGIFPSGDQKALYYLAQFISKCFTKRKIITSI